jgi:anaerobic selenocysteine-containing dehydrogenase
MEYRKWEKGLLRKDGKPGFETPSGKFEIKSSVLEQYGYCGIPKYEESVETSVSNPKLAKRYPLVLGTGPFKPDMKSCLRAIPAFIKKYPYPVIQMNEKDAKDRGIKMGDRVSIKTTRGSVQMRAYVTGNIMEGFAYAPVGGGGPQGTDEWQQANVNVLADMEQFDEISGFPIYKTMLCQIKKKKRNRKGIAVQDPTLGCGG